MARKLNKKLVGLLTLSGMVLISVGFIVLLRSLPGQDPLVYAQEAAELESGGEYNRAKQTYYRAYMKDAAKDPEYLVKAARCAIEDGDIRGAQELLQLARVRNSNLKSAAELSLEFGFELAWRFHGASQWHRVLDGAQALLDLGVESPLVYRAFGSAYWALRDEEDEFAAKGEENLKRAWQLDSANADVVKSLAGVLWTKASGREAAHEAREADELRAEMYGILASAVEQCEAGGNREGAAAVRRARAKYRIMEGKVDEGLAELESLAATETTTAESHILLGQVYTGSLGNAGERRDAEKAEAALVEALKIDPGNGEAYQVLGRVYRSQHDSAADHDEQVAKGRQEAELYERGLSEIPYNKHFRSYADNQSRVYFMSELCFQCVDRAERTEVEEEKAAALEEAESWVEALKGEVDLESTPVRMLTAYILNVRKEYIAAIREAEAACNGLAKRGRAYYRLQLLLGELYARQRQWGAAREAIRNTLALTPSSPMLRLRLARVYLQMNKASDAMSLLNPTDSPAMRRFMEQNKSAIQLRIEAYRQLGQFDQVEKLSRSLGEDTPEDELRGIRIMMLDGRQEEAEAALKAFLSRAPDNVGANALLLRLYATTDRVDAAFALLGELKKRDPENREWQRVELVLRQGAGEDQDEQMLAYLKEEPDAFTRAMSVANYYSAHDDFKEAAKYLDEAESLHPDDKPVIDQQFQNALRLKDWDRAEQYVAKNAALNLDGTEGKLAQGRLALAKGEYERAIDLMKTGLQKYTKDSLGWTYLAEAYGLAGHLLEAKNTLLRALEINPANGYANRGLAELALREGNDEEARRYLEAAILYLPDDPMIRRHLQELRERDNPAEGIATREEMRRQNPKDVRNLVLLARLYADPAVADYDKAAEVYEEVLKQSSSDYELAREVAGFYGREGVDRPEDGEALLKRLMEAEKDDKAKKALLAVYLGQFHESQKELATADRHFRLAVNFDPSPEVLTYAAEFCARTNRLTRALEYYERVAKHEGVDEGMARTARLRMIALLLATSDMDRAKQEIDDYMGAYPDDSQGMVYEGAYHRIGGDIQKAKEAFDGHLERDPDNAMALWQRAQLYLLMGQPVPAIEDLKRAKTERPDGFGYEHRITLAKALLDIGKEEEAIGELRHILDEKPEEQAVAVALVDVYTSAHPPRYSDAEGVIYTYLRRYPNDAAWPMMLGRLGELSGDWNKAVRGYSTAAEVARSEISTVEPLFRSLRKMGRPQEIIDYASDKLPSQVLSRSPVVLSTLAWAYSTKGDQEKCFATFDRAMTAAGADVRAYANVIIEMRNVLGPEKALERVSGQVESHPDSVDARKALVLMLQISGKNEEALTACQRVGELAERDTDVLFSKLGQAMLHASMDHYLEAKAMYEACLKLDPNNAMALNNLAYLLTENLGQAEEALPYAQRAKRLNADNADVLDTLGWVLFKCGRHGEAVGVFLRALEIERENPVVLYHLGLVHIARGELEEAGSRLNRARDAAKATGQGGLLPKISEALDKLN
ncbi:MAG: tetratricopeptide repeat protein [Planctomycetota bacterium]